LKIESSKVSCLGIKFSIKQGDKEIARAFLYIMHNDLHNAPFGLMEDVFVESGLRGLGIGMELIKKIIEAAKEHGCYKLIAASRHSRHKVHKLYKKLGFSNHGVEFRINFV